MVEWIKGGFDYKWLQSVYSHVRRRPQKLHGGAQMLMSDKDIREAMSSEELIIRNFSPKVLQPASYDMRVGKEAFSSHEKGRIDVTRERPLVIKPGDFILIRTYESIKLSPRIAGRIGLRSFYARKGLALLAGPQIDPGFDGVLVVGLHNLDANELKLPYRDPFCTVEFYRLSEPVQQPYQGDYQHQRKINERDCMAIKERIPAWSPIDNRLKELEEKVDSLLGRYREREVIGRKFKFDWEGELSDLKEKFTSVELQHKALEWR